MAVFICLLYGVCCLVIYVAFPRLIALKRGCIFLANFLSLTGSRRRRVSHKRNICSIELRIYFVNKRPKRIIQAKFQNFRFFYFAPLRLIFTRSRSYSSTFFYSFPILTGICYSIKSRPNKYFFISFLVKK